MDSELDELLVLSPPLCGSCAQYKSKDDNILSERDGHQSMIWLCHSTFACHNCHLCTQSHSLVGSNDHMRKICRDKYLSTQKSENIVRIFWLLVPIEITTPQLSVEVANFHSYNCSHCEMSTWNVWIWWINFAVYDWNRTNDWCRHLASPLKTVSIDATISPNLMRTMSAQTHCMHKFLFLSSFAHDIVALPLSLSLCPNALRITVVRRAMHTPSTRISRGIVFFLLLLIFCILL